MPQSDDPRAIVEHVFADYAQGDIPGVLSLVSPDIVWISNGPEHVVPFAGAYAGREGVSDFLEKMAAALTDPSSPTGANACLR